jgi:hypothetical protein
MTEHQLEQSVLNNSIRLIKRPTFYHRQHNRAEKLMFACEDNMLASQSFNCSYYFFCQ